MHSSKTSIITLTLSCFEITLTIRDQILPQSQAWRISNFACLTACTAFKSYLKTADLRLITNYSLVLIPHQSPLPHTPINTGGHPPMMLSGYFDWQHHHRALPWGGSSCLFLLFHPRRGKGDGVGRGWAEGRIEDQRLKGVWDSW